jgi:HAD superfamily hydrolase (TIGR01509 family)
MTGSSPRRGVLFDVDGTLVDTSYHHTLAWWHALRDHGREVPLREIHRAIGMGADMLLPHLIGHADADLSTAHGHYFAPYLEQVQVFAAAPELLRACKERGLVVVLASSSQEEELTRLRREIDAEDAIDYATAAADVEQSKPAPDLVQTALEKSGLRATDAVMVGDTKWDVEAAAKAGVACVGLMCGGWGADELREAGAAEVWASPTELLAHLDESILLQRKDSGD